MSRRVVGRRVKMTAVPTLADYAERSRLGDWSLRSALVRYAQPEPARAGAVLELVRRTDGALKPYRKLLDADADGRLEATARSVADDDDAIAAVERAVADAHWDDDETSAVRLLVVAAHLDRLGDVLAAWACDIGRARPDDEVDRLARRTFGLLSQLGVARETRPSRRS